MIKLTPARRLPSSSSYKDNARRAVMSSAGLKIFLLSSFLILGRCFSYSRRKLPKEESRHGMRHRRRLTSTFFLFQPRVTVVESTPARKVIGSISMPNGSPWCQGRPTYWLIGHEKADTPHCLTFGGEWMVHGNGNGSTAPVLDLIDDLNNEDSKYIDRHDCFALDVNYDGLMDIVCMVGANSGTGKGYHELYLTQRNGTVTKQLKGHGLHKYTSMRTRLGATLSGPNGEQLVFMGTNGKPRTDGKPNQHRMFRNTFSGDAKVFFEEVKGPWIQYFDATCVVPADINGDGIDDLIVCNKNGPPLLATQDATTGKWTKVVDPLKRLPPDQESWRNVRVAHVNGDHRPDLIVVTHGGKDNGAFVRIYKGIAASPYFQFKRPIYELKTPYAAPDVQVLDVNQDGVNDLYVVQVDEASRRTYCADTNANAWWGNSVQPYKSWVPPRDVAPDLLLVGQSSTTTAATSSFRVVRMEHSEPGCGYLVEPFGNNQTLLLAQGNFDHAGHNLLLEWGL